MSSVGLASGLNTADLISQLMSIERRPVYRLEEKVTAKEQQLSIYSDLRSKLTALNSSVSSLKTVSSFSKITATSSDEDFATISATGEAASGSHTLKISQLAQGAKSVSQGFSSDLNEIGTGTFRLDIGSETTDITLDATNSTLQGLKDAINNSDAEVTASVINDGDATNPYRLIISSDETGTANDHAISLVGWTGDTVDFTKGAGDDPGQTALDATFTFDGLDVTKSSNEVDDLLEGVTIYLRDDSEPTTVINLSLSSNISEVKATIQGFLDVYNETMSFLDEKSDSGAMRTDYAFSGIRSALQTLMSEGTPYAGGEYTTLSQVGIRTDHGQLKIDDADALTDALEDHFDDVINLFTTSGDPTSQYVQFVHSTDETASGNYAVEITGLGDTVEGTIGGYAANSYSGNFLIGADGTPIEGLMIKFSGSSSGSYGDMNFSIGLMEGIERQLDSYITGSGSLISTREDRINEQIEDYQDRIEAKERSLAKTESQLKMKFARMEQMISQLQVSQASLNSIY